MLYVVGLDRGHGGPDPGAIGPTGLREADVNEGVVQRAEQYLTRMRVRVVRSCARDQNPLQRERREVMLAGGAELVVSIHHNGHTSPDAHGMEAIVYPGERYDSGALAYHLLRRLAVNCNRCDRGIKVKQFTVCNAPIPAVMIEPAFVTNPEEERLLRQDWYLEKAALAIVEGIWRFMTA
ncbi:MAG: N-acetylmuramoyl-L-alanine amidase [bacterium]|nr:N-acetylmuramoyl-L-alanine amidase [bacterium]